MPINDVIIYGPAASSYVRTARMTCVEKDIPHRLEPVELGSDAHRALHPWSRVPVLRDGDVLLYETSAIVRYLDEKRETPRLTPKTAVARAAMEQWISAINCYVYDHVVRKYALVYVGAMLRKVEPDRAAIEAGVPAMQSDLAVLDRGYAKSAWLAGAELSLVDLFVAPIVATVSMFPEGKAALASTPHLARALEALQRRPSFAAAHAGLG